MIPCRCGCEQPARTAKGFNSRRCSLVLRNRQRGEDIWAARGPAPKCEFCQVRTTKWNRKARSWRRCCDRACSASLMSVNRTEAEKAANGARLRLYSQTRRARHVRLAVMEALAGRAALPAADVLDLVIRQERKGWMRGNHAAHAGMARAKATEAA